MKKAVIAVAVVASLVGAAVLVLDLLVDRIPPDALTLHALTETGMRARAYFDEHKRLPQSLSGLPIRRGYMNFTVDGWNHPLLFEAGENEIVVRSYGADGMEGGGGANADYEVRITKLPLMETLREVTRKMDGGKETILDKYPV